MMGRRNSRKMLAAGEEIVGDEPLSPTAQYFRSSVMDVSILAVFESEVAIDDSLALSMMENLFLPINPRFSSIMVKDEHGTAKWKRVKVNLEDHINTPLFPVVLEYYDDCVKEYLTRIAMEKLPQHRPLWNMHVIKYPTRNAAGILVIKLHHSLGDGFSLMSALFNCVERADDPSLPLTFPSREQPKQGKRRLYRGILHAFSVGINTIRDFGADLLISTMLKDDRNLIRSGEPDMDSRPVTISSLAFSLNDIKEIKEKLKGTVNDVITGTIFYGIRLYTQQVAKESIQKKKVTALVLLNTRAIKTYQSPQEMIAPDSKAPWGNHFTFLLVPVPKCDDNKMTDPIYFVCRAKQLIKRRRNSLGIYLTARLLDLIRKIKGPEAGARYIHNTLTNTSMAISNLIGPKEQIQIGGHPAKSLYFMMVRAPQSLTITVVSYMGEVKLAFGADKDFIDSEVLASSMQKSFERIFEAAVGNRNMQKF